MVRRVGSSALSIRRLPGCWPCALISGRRSGSALFPQELRFRSIVICGEAAACEKNAVRKMRGVDFCCGCPSVGEGVSFGCAASGRSAGSCWPSRAPAASWGRACPAQQQGLKGSGNRSPRGCSPPCRVHGGEGSGVLLGAPRRRGQPRCVRWYRTTVWAPVRGRQSRCRATAP